MKSLVDIAYRRVKRQEVYNRRFGEGTFGRSSLRSLNGNRVTVTGWVVAIKRKSDDIMVTLKDASVGGIVVEHINYTVPSVSDVADLSVEALRGRLYVTFSATVCTYLVSGQIVYGIKHVSKVKLLDKVKSVDFEDFKLIKYSSGVGATHLNWNLHKDKGYIAFCVPKTYKKDKDTIVSMSNRSNFMLRSYLKCSTYSEFKFMISHLNRNKLLFSKMIESYIESKEEPEYLCYLISGVSDPLVSELDNISVNITNQAFKYVNELLAKGYSILPLKKRHTVRFGVPLVLESDKSNHYVIIDTSISHKLSPISSDYGISKLVRDFHIPSGSRISVYNAANNVIANSVVS